MKCVRALLSVDELGNVLKIHDRIIFNFYLRLLLITVKDFWVDKYSGMSQVLKLTARLMSLTWTSSGLHFPNSFTSTVGASTGTLSPQSSPDMAEVWTGKGVSFIDSILCTRRKRCLVNCQFHLRSNVPATLFLSWHHWILLHANNSLVTWTLIM